MICISTFSPFFNSHNNSFKISLPFDKLGKERKENGLSFPNFANSLLHFVTVKKTLGLNL